MQLRLAQQQLFVWVDGDCHCASLTIVWPTMHIGAKVVHQMGSLPQMSMLLMRYVFVCCVQLLIMKDGEWNHSMGSPMDRTPPQSENR